MLWSNDLVYPTANKFTSISSKSLCDLVVYFDVDNLDQVFIYDLILEARIQIILPAS
jgi:hypothetical protein